MRGAGCSPRRGFNLPPRENPPTGRRGCAGSGRRRSGCSRAAEPPCAAGKAAHLAGAFAAQTTLPVIGIPVKSSTLDGLDALLSTVQMPSGIPVATVAVDGAVNAALLACEILAVTDDALAERLSARRAADTQKVLAANADCESQYNC